ATFKDGDRMKTGYYNFVIQPLELDTVTEIGLMVHVYEVTRQVESYKKVQESEQRFTNMLAQSPYAFAILKGEEMSIYSANDAIKEVWGKGNDIEGKPLLSIMPEIAEQGFPELLQEVYTTGNPFNGHEVPVRLKRKGKWEDVFFNFVYQPYREADGTISGVVIIANETTSQVVAHKKAIDSQNQFKQIINNAPLIVWSVDTAGIFTMSEGKALKNLGIADDELVGQSYFELYKNAPQAISSINRALQGETFTEIVPLLNRVYETLYTPTIDAFGSVAGVAGVSTDVTERFKAEKELAERESYLRRLTETVPVIIWITEANGTCSYLNRHWYEFTGQQPKDAEGFGWLNAIHPDDREEVGKIFLKAHEAHMSFSILYRLCNQAGDYRWVKDNGSPKFSHAREFEGFIGTVVDVHEEKLSEERLRVSEERYRTLFNSIDEGFCTIDLIFDEYGKPFDYRYLEVNKAFAQQTGLKDPVGKTTRDLAIMEDFWYEMFGNVAITGTGVRFEHSAENLNRYYDVYAFKIGSQDERKVGVLFTDITDRKAASLKLQETADLLQNVFDSAPNGVAVMKTIYDDRGKVEDFSILLFNAFTLNWLTDTDYKGKRYGDMFPMVKQTGILEQFREVAETGITANFERWYTGEGMKHWFRFTVVKQGELLVVTTEDITERKRAEEAFTQVLQTTQKQQRLYDSVTNNTPDLVYVFDLNYRFTYANKALLTMWGKTAEEAIGKGLRDNGYEEWHAAMHEREIDLVASSKKPIRGTVSFPHAELGKRVYDYIFAPVFNEQGEVEAIAGTTRDITDIKKAELNLKESESRLRNIIDKSPDPIAIFKGEEMLLEIGNEPLFRIWQVGRDSIGKGILEILPEMRDQALMERLLYVYRTGDSFFGQERPAYFIREDGSKEIHYFNLVFQPFREADGLISGVLATGTDVTKQVLAKKAIEESESRFRSLANDTPAFMFMADVETKLEFVNQQWLKFTGLDASSRFGKMWEQLTHPLDIPEMNEVYQNAVATLEPYEFEVRQRRHDGEYRWVLWKGIPRKDGKGAFAGIMGVGFDITEQREFSERLEVLVGERTKELQRSNEDLQQFAHVASHDLKEPVRKVKTFASRLEHHLNGKLDETSNHFLQRIHSAADRMFTMIDGVLTYSTINAYTQVPQSVDLNEVMINIETDLEVIIQKTGTQFQYKELPKVEGAFVLLYQLLYNLVNNSMKFAKVDVPPTIQIISEIVAEGNRQFAKIVLADNGIGFEESQGHLIFDTFTRLNSKDKYEGTGLGLALCKKIVERHGGRISASGVPGEGAAFTMLLPLRQNEASI
ncbi:MAG TPA: PAS domain S-box protein, partial [Flavitalea sp.]|nr:PAS domain S-box protein [Flavitalea sp.]